MKRLMTTYSQSNPLVIFAADDDHDDLAMLRMLLRKAGVEYPLELYHEGEEIVAALSKLVQNSFNAFRPLLCFLDVKMSTLTGHDVLRWIRAQPSLNKVPVIFLSGSDHPADLSTARDNGAQCYLTKYPAPAVLRQVVDEARRFGLGAPAFECFRLPMNQLLK